MSEDIKIGDVYYTKRGETLEIVGFRNKTNVDVLFKEHNWIKYNEYLNDIKRGDLKSPFTPSVYNVGYLGLDFYNYKGIGKLKEYMLWRNMLKRCYHESLTNNRNEYTKITVCEEWHNFSNFYKWYQNNYYTVDNETMSLDKDILNKNTYQYSPENCIFVPMRINVTFEKLNKEKCKNRSKDTPIGVQWIKADKIYGASCRVGNGKAIWLGRSKDATECFNRYKECKENHLKQLANEYKDKIPKNLYDAVYNYKIEITD